jgi:restriction system protein
MLPFMQHITDGNEHSTSETHDALALHFKLTNEELNQYLPSGKQTTFYNRIYWAKAHLKMAGLVENIKRGHFRITEQGKQVLSTKPSEINLRFLKQFPEYIENTGKNRTDEKSNSSEADNDSEINATPEEIIESSYIKIRKNLALELLTKIKSSTPTFFENLVVELLVKMGYGGTIKEAGKSIGRSGDEGIDGVIKEDRLGLDIIYIQAKRWENVVGRPEIQKFVGALAGQGAKKGVFITTSRFTDEAKEYQPKNETKIVLIDGKQLAELMIDYDLAVATTHTFTIKRIDNDYFEE